MSFQSINNTDENNDTAEEISENYKHINRATTIVDRELKWKHESRFLPQWFFYTFPTFIPIFFSLPQNFLLPIPQFLKKVVIDKTYNISSILMDTKITSVISELMPDRMMLFSRLKNQCFISHLHDGILTTTEALSLLASNIVSKTEQ